MRFVFKGLSVTEPQFEFLWAGFWKIAVCMELSTKWANRMAEAQIVPG
jgi:hypothetical protein